MAEALKTISIIQTLITLLASMEPVFSTYRVVCYYENWAQYQHNPEQGKAQSQFSPEDIDPSLCTHLNYAFAGVDATTHTITTTEWNDEEMFERVMELKLKNPKLKILLAVGGYKHGADPFISMTANVHSRTHFINHSIYYLRKHQFDGLDIDWEFKKRTGDFRAAKEGFTALCQELRSAYDKEAKLTNQISLLLTASVSAHKDIIDQRYQPDKIRESLDYINVMAYDFHGPWDNHTSHNAPLYGTKDDTATVQFAAEYWEKLGMPVNKIVVGLPAYGIVWTKLSNSTSIDNRAKWFGQISYNSICSQSSPPSQFTAGYDRLAETHLLTNEHKWISYDDQHSLSVKCEYIKRKRYGGAMIWSLSKDDYNGQSCSNGTYPLHRTVSNCLLGKHTEDSKSMNFMAEIFEKISRSRDEITLNMRKMTKCQLHVTVFLFIFTCSLFFGLRMYVLFPLLMKRCVMYIFTWRKFKHTTISYV